MIGALTASTGNVALSSTGNLTVSSVISATGGNVVLDAVGASGTLSVGANIAASSTGTVSAIANTFTDTAGSITGGMFEYAPDTASAVVLGTAGNLVDLTGVATSNVRIGEANGNSATATGITLASGFDLKTGAAAARPLDLQATGNVTDGANHAFINVTTLTGTVAGGSVSLTHSAGGIGTIGAFTVTGTGQSFNVTESGSLAVTGTLSAPGVTLSADSLTISGPITTGGTATGAVSLLTNIGTISGAGIITTGTLGGSAATTVNLSGANLIGSLGSFSATGFTLNDATPLTVGNTLSAAAVSLTAPGISITGEVTDGGAGTVALFANVGSITESGTLIAGTLSGSAVAAISLLGATPTTNSIANLGSISGASLTLDNNPDLTITNNVSLTGSVSLTDNGSITIKASQTLSGTAVALSGGGIVIDGVVTDGGSGTVSLISSLDNGISEFTGTIIAGTLSGSVGKGGTANLPGNSATANQIGNLGSFSGGSIGSSLILVDGSALTVTGSVSMAQGVSLTSGGLLTVGSGQTITAGSVLLSGTAVAIAGLVTAAGTVDLIASTSSIPRAARSTRAPLSAPRVRRPS